MTNSSTNSSDPGEIKKFSMIRQRIGKAQKTLSAYLKELIEAVNVLSEQVNPISKWPIIFYLFCVSVALSCSAFYHLFYPLSPCKYLLTQLSTNDCQT